MDFFYALEHRRSLLKLFQRSQKGGKIFPPNLTSITLNSPFYPRNNVISIKDGQCSQFFLSILKEQDQGIRVTDLCRKHGISDQTFHNWKKKYDGLVRERIIEPGVGSREPPDSRLFTLLLVYLHHFCTRTGTPNL
jgi:hypothetical protein